MHSTFSRIVFWLLTFAVGLVPLVFWHGFFFPHVFAKTILFRTLVEMAFAVWLALVLLKKEYRPRLSLINAMMGIVFGILVLSSFLGENLYKSLWSDMERMMGLVTYLHIFLFALMLPTVARERKDWDLFFTAFALSAWIVGISGIFDWLGSEGRIGSTIGNASFLASYVLLSSFIIAALLMEYISRPSEKRESWRLWLYGSALFLLLPNLLFAESRGALVGLAAGALFWAGCFAVFSDKKGSIFGISNALLKRIIIAGFALVLLAWSGVFLFKEQVRPYLSPRMERLLLIGTNDTTAAGRVLVWGVSWSGWKEHFLFGWGPENYHILFDKHYDSRLIGQEPWFDRAHNIIFDWGTTSGVFGLIAYIALCAAGFRSFYRSFVRGVTDFYSTSLLSAFFVAYFVHDLFTFDVLTSYIPVFSVLAFASFLEAGKSVSVPEKPVFASRQSFLWVGALAFVAMTFVWYQVNAKIMAANAVGHKGWEALRIGSGDKEALDSFEKAVSYGAPGSIDVRRFSVDYVFEAVKQGVKRPENSMRLLYDYAGKKTDENIAADPKNVKWIMYRGELYNLSASAFNPEDAVKAEEYFLKAKGMSQGRVQIYLELAQARRMQKNYEGMWGALDEAIALLPDEPLSHLNAAVHAIELGDEFHEKREVEWLESRTLAYDILRDAYFRAKRYSRAVYFQELYVADVDSEYPDAEIATRYAHLAALYQYAGDKEKAREAALKVLKHDHSRKAEVGAFLDSLDR